MTTTTSVRALALLTIVICFTSNKGVAQWTTQTIDLRPGWTAVYLEIQPEPAECDVLFADMPIESVWCWNRRFESVQYIQDPASLVPGQEDWLVWAPEGSPARGAINLYQLQVGATYLIRVSDDALPFSWQINGRPVIRTPQWISNSLNLKGFSIDGLNRPTFASFFAASPAHADQPVYRLNASGQWTPIADLGATAIQPGEAFWIRTQGSSTFAGPLRVQCEQEGVLDYARILNEQTLRIKNESSGVREVTVRASLIPTNLMYDDEELKQKAGD